MNIAGKAHLERQDDRHERDQGRQLRGRWHDGPHHAMEGRAQDRADQIATA
jgi:hypothetical protein